jgi:flagellar biosynthetic protein FliQ
MGAEYVIELTRSLIWLAIELGAPVLSVALVVGVAVSVVQAATQINEMTLTFIPKLVAVGLVLWVMSGWMIDTWLGFVQDLFGDIETVALGR